jgi:PKD repeat protein
MNRRKITLFFLVSAVSVLLALPAAAWTKKDTCNGSWTRWRLSEETLNVSAAVSQFYTVEWRNTIEAAKSAWTTAPAQNFDLYLHWTLGSVPGVSGDTKDDLSLGSSSTWTYGISVPAVTKHMKSDCSGWNPLDVAHYTEVDVVVNPAATQWNKSTNPVPSDSMINTTLFLAHEFGHVIGLGDENGELAAMNRGFPGPMGGPVGNDNKVQALGDDIIGLRTGYGDPGASDRDVAASAVKFVSPGVSKVIAAPATATRGTVVSFQFTIINRSRTIDYHETIPVYFYLSPTRNTSLYSFYLGSTTITLNDGDSTTGTVNVLIPANAPTGNQYLGWYADPANGIPETDETNNAVALVSPTYISANPSPIACFTATPSSGYSPLNVSLNASCSSDPDADPLTYSWQFNDGSTDSGPTISHTFYYAGYHQVLLTVTDPSGASSQTYRYISVACRQGGFCPEEPY